MTGNRWSNLTALAAGTLWALAVVFGAGLLGLPYLPAPVAVPVALLAPGLVLAAMIAWRGLRGDSGRSPRVLAETMEQLVLALALWPFVATTMGGGAAILLGLSLGLMRLLAWAAGDRLPFLRALGFAGSLLPTILAALWALRLWAI